MSNLKQIISFHLRVSCQLRVGAWQNDQLLSFFFSKKKKKKFMDYTNKNSCVLLFLLHTMIISFTAFLETTNFSHPYLIYSSSSSVSHLGTLRNKNVKTMFYYWSHVHEFIIISRRWALVISSTHARLFGNILFSFLLKVFYWKNVQIYLYFNKNWKFKLYITAKKLSCFL